MKRGRAGGEVSGLDSSAFGLGMTGDEVKLSDVAEDEKHMKVSSLEERKQKMRTDSENSSALRHLFSRLSFSFLMMCSSFLFSSSLWALNQTYSETFDNRQSGTTINEVDSWAVHKGPNASVVVQADTVYGGGGKALKLAGDEDAVHASRAQSLGNLTPTWIEYKIKPGVGKEAAAIPSRSIGAVTFNYSGEVLAANGTAWVSTGVTFDPEEWYQVLMRIDFNTKLYDVYVWPVNADKIPFVADKQNLKFIDNTINSVSELGFKGVFNSNGQDDTFIDDLTVHFMQRMEVITTLQTIVKETPSDPIIVQLQNADSEPQTAWKDITLDLLTSSPNGSFSLMQEPWVAVTQVVIPEGSQEATFYYKDSDPGKPVINIKEFPSRGWQEALHQVTVVGEIRAFDVETTSPQVAGRPFTVTVTAKEEDGAPNQTYQGPVRIYARYVNPSAGTMMIAPDQFTGFEQGVGQVTLTYPDAGTIEIVVEDTEDTSKNGVSGQVLFLPARFSASAGTSYKVSEPFSLTLSALNEGGQVTPNYKGTAVLTAVAVSPASAGGGIFSPGTLTPEYFQNGVAEISASYDHWGTIQIEAADQANPEIKGQSGAVLFSPHALAVKIVQPADRDYFYTNENFDVKIEMQDHLSQPIKNFSGIIQLSSEPNLNLPEQYTLVEEDGGAKTFSLAAANPGTYKISAKSMEYNLSADSPPVKVESAVVQVISTVAPVGTTEVEIQLVDAKGKRITRENNVTIQIVVYEDDGDRSYFSSSLDKPVTFRNGLAKIVLGNSEAETVTLGVETKYGFEIKPGTVTFGKMGKSGIGALMWWESKDDEAEKDEEENEELKIEEKSAL